MPGHRCVRMCLLVLLLVCSISSATEEPQLLNQTSLSTTSSSSSTETLEGLPGNSTAPPQHGLSPADYWQFRVGSAINFWAPPVITVIGVVGNVVSFMVMMQAHNRASSPGLYMAALAVADFIMIVVGLFQYWCLFNFFPHLVTEQHCHGMFFIVNFVANYGVWVIVAMTLERFIVVVFPFKSHKWTGVGKTKIILVVLVVASAAKNLHYIHTADFMYNKQSGAAQCAFGLVRTGTWVIVWQWIDTSLSAIVPFIIILVANCSIIISVNRQKAHINRLSSTRRTGKESKEKNRARSDSSSITVMLISVSLAFVLLTSPLFLFRTYFNFVSKDTPHTLAIYHLGHHACHKLWYTNNAINFYLYCLTGRKFRNDLRMLWMQARGKAVSFGSSRETTGSSLKHSGGASQGKYPLTIALSNLPKPVDGKY